MKLAVFNGGLQTSVAKSLVPATSGVVCENVDLATGVLMGVKGTGTPQSTLTARYSTFWVSENTFIQDPLVTEYLPYRNYLLKFDSTLPWLVGAEVPLGLSAPETAPVITEGATGPLSGTYQYCYTYYNDNLGIESPPSPLSAELTVTGKAINVSVVGIGLDTVVRIYRIGGIYSDFMLVAEVSQGELEDSLADGLITGKILDTYTNQPPIATMRGVSERQGIYFGCVGTKVYYSSGLGEPWYWPATNYIEFFEQLVGTASVGLYTYVFTKTKTYMLIGDTTTLTRILLSAEVGAATLGSIATLTKGVLFCSDTGVCVANNGTVTNISTGILAPERFNVLRSVVHADVYYGLMENSVLVVNLQAATPRFSFITSSWQDICSNGVDLFASHANVRYYLDGPTLPYKYKTGWLTEGELTNVKTYDKFYFYTDGPVTVKIFLDGDLATTVQCTAGMTEVTTPQELRNAYYCELEIQGQGALFEVNYLVTPRQT